MHRYCVPLVGACVLGGGILLHTSGRPNGLMSSLMHGKDRSLAVRSPPVNVKPAEHVPLRVQKVRVEPVAGLGTSADVKFQLANDGSATLTDIVVEVSIVERSLNTSEKATTGVVAGPYTIRGKVLLPPLHTADFVMRLSDLDAHRCLAHVKVISARTLSPAEESGPAVARIDGAPFPPTGGLPTDQPF